VAALKTTAVTVIADYGRLMRLACYAQTYAAAERNALSINPQLARRACRITGSRTIAI